MGGVGGVVEDLVDVRPVRAPDEHHFRPPFANIAFAPKGTIVIEFLPNGAIFNSPAFKEHLSTYQQAMALGHRYYSMMCAYSKNDDMIVNMRDLLTTLKNALGNGKRGNLKD